MCIKASTPGDARLRAVVQYEKDITPKNLQVGVAYLIVAHEAQPGECGINMPRKK
jgi:hypothetical protein